MKKLVLLALLSLSTLVGYSQTYNTTISVHSYLDSTCGGVFQSVSILPNTPFSVYLVPSPNPIGWFMATYYYNAPLDTPVTYHIYAKGICGCIFDTTFTTTYDSTHPHSIYQFHVGGNDLDGVQWTSCPFSTGVNELKTPTKNVVRIIDVLGRETTPEPNKVFIYLYSDGTIERKLIVKE